MGCRGRWKKIIHSEAHEFQILADENSLLNFWNWKFWSGTVLCAQCSGLGSRDVPRASRRGCCRIHLNQRFCFSVAQSVGGADSFLARVMTDFLKILPLLIQLRDVINWHKTWQLLQSRHKCTKSMSSFNLDTNAQSTADSLFSATREYVKENCDLGLLKNMNLCVHGPCVRGDN